MKVEIGARVRTRDGRDVGEVHRVLVDLEDNAVTGIVVLKGRLLSRDILVPRTLSIGRTSTRSC